MDHLCCPYGFNIFMFYLAYTAAGAMTVGLAKIKPSKAIARHSQDFGSNESHSLPVLRWQPRPDGYRLPRGSGSPDRGSDEISYINLNLHQPPVV